MTSLIYDPRTVGLSDFGPWPEEGPICQAIAGQPLMAWRADTSREMYAAELAVMGHAAPFSRMRVTGPDLVLYRIDHGWLPVALVLLRQTGWNAFKVEDAAGAGWEPPAAAVTRAVDGWLGWHKISCPPPPTVLRRVEYFGRDPSPSEDHF